MSYHLAIDIGASSGRHLLFHMQDGRLVQEGTHETLLHQEGLYRRIAQIQDAIALQEGGNAK